MLHSRKDYMRIQDPAGLIPADEPVFLLRAQDAHCIRTLIFYIGCFQNGVVPDSDTKELVDSLQHHVNVVRQWQERNAEKVKYPDLKSKDECEKLSVIVSDAGQDKGEKMLRAAEMAAITFKDIEGLVDDMKMFLNECYDEGLEGIKELEGKDAKESYGL